MPDTVEGLRDIKEGCFIIRMMNKNEVDRTGSMEMHNVYSYLVSKPQG
jgi:hypothetical protein